MGSFFMAGAPDPCNLYWEQDQHNVNSDAKKAVDFKNREQCLRRIRHTPQGDAT